MKLDDILEKIASSNTVDPADLLPFQCLELQEERCRVNVKLAEANFKAGNLPQAKIFIQRGWLLSQFDEDLLLLYVDINSAADDVEAIKEAYKRVGMKKVSEQNVGEALKYFTSSMYSYFEHKRLDKYEYDFEMLEGIKRLAEPDRFAPAFKPGDLNSRKVRLAYLVYGILHDGSVMVKINRLFAEFHDKSRFEIAFFIPEEKKRVLKWKQAVKNLDAIRDYGCDVFLAPNISDQGERLRHVARQIHEFQPDAMVTSALLADLGHFYIASLSPAPVTIGFSQGPPPQFVSPDLDWSIAWTKHPLIDSPCNCSLVPLEVDLPDAETITVCAKDQLNIPEEGTVLMSGGRYVKFQNPDFWKTIVDILCANHNIYYVAIGLDQKPDFLNELLTPEIEERLRFIGWSGDYLGTLGLADIVVDTFPSGGGVVIVDAMALGIPVVAFRNNYLKLFDQTDWSPAEEFIEMDDLIVERGDFAGLKHVISKLMSDKDYYREISEQCREQIHLSRGNPERMVLRCENIYRKAIGQKMKRGGQSWFKKVVKNKKKAKQFDLSKMLKFFLDKK